MFFFATNPSVWGLGIITSLLKPGKPHDQPSSLRGIRLLSRLSAWMGQILDRRLRTLWSAGPEQFGFRVGVGCLEAVFALWTLMQSRLNQRKRLFVAFIDLRTAFPSLCRPILIQRLFQCGASLGLCRLLLSMFDVTVSIVRIGAWFGAPFTDKLGVREGAVESPHLFNMYIGELRTRLETLHPSLCKLLHITIVILLYADDAALPADSLEDLQLSLNIFVDFCNEMHLYVATAKTFLVVFHNDDDEGVVYNNGHVYVDGQMAKLMVYGDQIKATDSFKYLGMMLHASGTLDCHADSRISAFTRATNFVLIGLSKIPGFSHAFLKSLWRSLIEPVGLYGMELCEGRTGL